MTRHPQRRAGDRPRTASGVRPATGSDPTLVATPQARRGAKRFRDTSPPTGQIERRVLPFTRGDERRSLPPSSDPPTSSHPPPSSYPPASPWQQERPIDSDALPSALMPESLKSDPPPSVRPSSRVGLVVALSVGGLALLTAIAMWLSR